MKGDAQTMSKPSKPKVVCLIGSTRFFREFQRAAYEAELAGEITVGPAFTPGVGPREHGGTVGITPEQKAAVDAAFVHKIAMADEVLVINVGGYVGASTRKDIEFAKSICKPVIPFLFQTYNNSAILGKPEEALLCDRPKIFLLGRPSACVFC